MAGFLRLRRMSDNEYVVINPAEIVKVRCAERGTSVVYLRNATSEHVYESVDEIAKLLEKE